LRQGHRYTLKTVTFQLLFNDKNETQRRAKVKWDSDRHHIPLS